ncbi:MAG: lipid A deacylase LpxR family protein [Pseudomonadota bacterium]
MTIRHIAATASFVVLLSTASAHAQNEEGPPQKDRGVTSIVVENDLFGGADRNYSNGLRLERFAPAKRAHPWLRRAASWIPGVDIEQTEVRQGWGIAHAIFTPEDIEAPIPDPNDRPYAGWLHFSGTAVATSRDKWDQHAIQINVGVVGESAGAEFVQTEFHKLIDGKEPRGWDAELSDELGVELIAERLRRLRKTRVGPLEFDSAVFGGVTLGNVHTHASLGAMVRAGFDLDADFGPPRIRPALGGSGAYNPSDPLGGYLFVGLEGRAVARNIFLDGNTFVDGPRVDDRRDFVGDLQAGIALNAGPTQVAFTYVHRTEQFVAQRGPDRFGAVSVSLAY